MTKKKQQLKSELNDQDFEFLPKEQAYWTKALAESEETMEKLQSALKYESAVNEMCKAKLKAAKDETR